MDNNQYFFSNEEGSNDSNINMIGGGMMAMGPMSNQQRLNKAKELVFLFKIQHGLVPKVSVRGEVSLNSQVFGVQFSFTFFVIELVGFLLGQSVPNVASFSQVFLPLFLKFIKVVAFYNHIKVVNPFS